MNIVFTDIDGVLNPNWRKKWCKKSIKYYNDLCKEFNLRPVITSTWRLNYTIVELQAIFDEQGVLANILDYTPFIDQADRGLEIKAWLDKNNCDKFIIFDDIVNNITPHIGNVIKCNTFIGISKSEYKEAVNYLNNEK
jgi:hypothetical protein